MEKYGTAVQTTDGNMVQGHSVIDMKVYKRTLTKCNSFCFATATAFARKRFNIMLYVHCYVGQWLAML